MELEHRRHHANVWALVGLFTLAYWGTSTDPQYPILLVEFLSREFGVGTGASSMPIVMASAGAIIGTMAAGLTSRRLGIGFLIFVNLWGFALFSFLNTREFAFISSPAVRLGLFDATRFLTGLCQGALSLLFLLGVGVFVHEHRRGLAVGVLSAGSMLAVAAVPLLVQATAPGGDWHMPFYFFGAAALIGVVGLHAVRMPLRPVTTLEEISALRVLRSWRMLSLMCLGGLILVSIVAMATQFTVFAKRQFGWELHQTLPQLITLGVGAVVGALVAGKLSDRLGPRIILIWTSVAVTVIFVLVPILARTAWAVYPVFFTMSALAAARVPPYQALMLKIIPEKARGPVLGLRNVISYTGTAVGAGVGGVLYERLGSYQWVALFAGVMSLLVLVIVWKFVPRKIELHMMG